MLPTITTPTGTRLSPKLPAVPPRDRVGLAAELALDWLAADALNGIRGAIDQLGRDDRVAAAIVRNQLGRIEAEIIAACYQLEPLTAPKQHHQQQAQQEAAAHAAR